MGKTSFNGLLIKKISQVVEETKKFIQDRRDGKEKSLKLSSHRMNKALMDGIDWNRIITIAGLPGSGKSTLARQWLIDMLELNKDQDFDILSFQFEMLGVDELTRDISSKVNRSIKQIYSAEGKISDEDYNKVEQELDRMKDLPLHIIDNVGTVSNIKDTILYYCSENNLAERNRSLVVHIDHSLLIKNEDNEDEKLTIDRLYHTLIALKKYLAGIGIKVIFIVLSQLNRNIETPERITNSKLHYPNKNDLFGASSAYYSSDYVIIIHRPAQIDGLGNWYGPPRGGQPGLPVFNPEDSTQPMIYLHIIKERFGSNGIIPMLDELAHARIGEYQKVA